MLFRAIIGFSIAFYAYDSQAARLWLEQAVVLPIEARCAQGLTLCEGDAAARIAAQLEGLWDGESAL